MPVYNRSILCTALRPSALSENPHVGFAPLLHPGIHYHVHILVQGGYMVSHPSHILYPQNPPLIHEKHPFMHGFGIFGGWLEPVCTLYTSCPNGADAACPPPAKLTLIG